MDVDAISQIADGREHRKQVTFDCTKPFLMARGVRVEVKSKRAETVRPLHDEHCECHFECDSAMSATSDVNDIELNGETDDEDMEDGETGLTTGARWRKTFVIQDNRLKANTETEWDVV